MTGEGQPSTDPGRFHPAPLPRWELKLSYAVWAIHSIGAFVLAHRVCSGPLRLWIEGILQSSRFVSGWKFDPSDSEWQYYTSTVGYLILAYASHSVIFNASYGFLNKDHARLVHIAAGLLLHVWVASPSCILTLAAFAAVAIATSAYFRREVIAWILCIGFIIKATHYAPFSSDQYAYYREFNVYLYGAIKILNVCINVCRNSDKPVSIDWLLGISHYLTYLPYSTILIVLYEEFAAQIERRNREEREPANARTLLPFALRLLLWSSIYECLIHLIPVGALFQSQVALSRNLNGYQMFAIAYVLGQYFHLKYTVIFGVPALFAKIDGMTPPPPPICISRVSRYSRMWRHFDAGLYSFLKNQVYLPLLTHPKLSAGMGRPLALVSAFLIVVAWHGSQRNYVCWVCLSALELVIERIGVLIWDSERFQKFRHKVGDLWVRRSIAWSMILTVAPGILGVFYFLGGEEFSDAAVKRILFDGLFGIATMDFTIVNGVPSAGLVLTHLFMLGYFFNNCCLELEYKNRKPPTKLTESNNNMSEAKKID